VAFGAARRLRGLPPAFAPRCTRVPAAKGSNPHRPSDVFAVKCADDFNAVPDCYRNCYGSAMPPREILARVTMVATLRVVRLIAAATLSRIVGPFSVAIFWCTLAPREEPLRVLSLGGND